MQSIELKIYNSLTRKKEVFKPILKDNVGMYVCGPTVYSDVHLGNCRTFMTFDIVYRYLLFLGYKVRYVRNITDVGHLENDLDDEGEDKIAKKARLEQLEPMEIVQRYSRGFHQVMELLNNLAPSIEPTATGHIVEQIEVIEKIIARGYGYERNGSIYFDTVKFAKDYPQYGDLSGKKMDDLFQETRSLKSQSEKENATDFALWMKADDKHIMRWPSPWGIGFPGWHLECSAMSTKYLGETFDIHGGGMDLQFPHHENEIAQNLGSCGCEPANFWMHGNMLTLNGKKMSKRDGSSILPHELFTGDNELLEKPYSPMTLRFLCLQTHYRSTLDLSDHALEAAEKGYKKLMSAYSTIEKLTVSGQGKSEEDRAILEILDKCQRQLADDFNTPMAIARLFDVTSKIFSLRDGHIKSDSVAPSTLGAVKEVFENILFSVCGLLDETQGQSNDGNVVGGLMELIIDMRKNARTNKDWSTSDQIRDTLKELNITIKDGKEETTWSLN